MAQRLRRTAPEANTLARLAGDEFAILLDGGTGTAALSRLAERLLVQLRQPVSVLGHELILGASLGISLFSEQAREISVLMSQANLAMQHAKQLGGNTFQFFRDNLQDSTLERLRLETRLRKAVEEGQLDVHYQQAVPGQRPPGLGRGAGALAPSGGGHDPAVDLHRPRRGVRVDRRDR